MSGKATKCYETEVINFVFGLSKELNIGALTGINGNELELIALVKNCKFLYDDDSKSKDANKIKKRQSAWMGMSTIFQCSVQDVIDKWNYVKSTYIKFKKSDIIDDVISSFFNDLNFLDPYIDMSNEYVIEEMELSQEVFYVEETSDVYKFIDLVKKRPILYNNKHKNFKSKSARDEQWRLISKSVGLSPLDCKNKWKRLRERYGRERKNGRNNGEKIWELYETLTFLDPHVRMRKNQSGFKIISKIDSFSIKNEAQAALNENSENDEIQYDYVNDLSNDIKCASPTSTEVIQFQTIDNKVGIDEDDLFGQTIAAELKKIKGKKKMKLKADIYRLLYENEESD